MVLPLFKVLSLVIRVFSKPLINYTKQVHLKNEFGTNHPHLRKTFIYLGNKYYRTQTWINRKFMKIQTQFAFKPLNDQLAIQKGIQFVYQILFYSIIIGLPLYQMIQSSKEAKQKSQQLQNKIRLTNEQINHFLQVKAKKLNKKQTMLREKDQRIIVSQYPNNDGNIVEMRKFNKGITSLSEICTRLSKQNVLNMSRIYLQNYPNKQFGESQQSQGQQAQKINVFQQYH